MTLFWKIYAGVFVLLLVTVVPNSYFQARRQLDNAQQTLVDEHETISRLIYKQMEVGYLENKWPFESLASLSRRPETLFWWVAKEDGTIHLANDAAFMGTDAHEYFPDIQLGGTEPVTVLHDARNFGVVVQPLQAGREKWTFWLGFSTQKIAAMHRHVVLTNIALALVTLAAIGAALYFIVRYYTRPVRGLARSAAILGAGNLSHRVRIESSDELGHLARSFNTMAEDLQRTTVSRDYVDDILATMTDALIVMDGDGKIRTVNHAACDMLGYAESELCGKPASTLLPLAADSQVHQAGAKDYETQCLARDGRRIPILLSCSTVKDEAGHITRMVCTGKDITLRKQAEEALRESEERFRELAEMLPETIFELDMTGRILFVNRHAFEAFGYVPEDIERGLSVADIMVPADRPKAMANLMRVLKGEGRFVGAFEAQRKDGTTFPVATYASPIVRNGKIAGTRGLVVDISQQRRAQEALETANRFQQKLLDTAATAIFSVDPQMRITSVNEAFCSITGFQPEEVLQKPCAVLRSESCAQGCRLLDPERHAPIVRRPCSLHAKNGRELSIIMTADVLRDDAGHITGGIESFVDVTELAEAREVIERANLRLQQLATTDELTGLCNRRQFLERLEAEVARSRRYNTCLALMMIDVDQFKSINDTYGHAFGDRVLREVAKLLQHEARETDLVARYAGDEFMVLMPATAASEAVSAAERIRKHMARRQVSDGHRMATVTISAGIGALADGLAITPEALVRLSDEALYAAKHSGRDCTRTWEQVSSEPPPESLVNADAAESLRRQVASLSVQSQEMFVESIQGLVQALDARDTYTRCHSENVTSLAVGIAETMHLSAGEIAVIRRAAMVHDIGKIGVPDSILRKPGPLSAGERRVMEQHPLVGVRILDHLRFLEREIPIVRHHHERWDGRGYPDSISGEAIPIGARILAVADSLDAITSQRVYRNGRSLPDALQLLIEASGCQFSPDVVDALLEWVRHVNHELGDKTNLTMADLMHSVVLAQ
jgi:diguanylate cyclase (GGDEF)-like protein/PAS domain S-box-containing protein/putative nucleotidyltransferase with HDIG domain